MAPARGAPPRRKTVRSRLAPGVPRRVRERDSRHAPPPELRAKPEQTIARVRTRRGCTATGGGMFERGSCTRANIRHCYTKTGDTPQDRSDVARLRGVAHSRSVFMSACVTRTVRPHLPRPRHSVWRQPVRAAHGVLDASPCVACVRAPLAAPVATSRPRWARTPRRQPYSCQCCRTARWPRTAPTLARAAAVAS